MKLTDMGTTGLIDYVLAGRELQAGRVGAARRMAATNVIRRRHGEEGVRRFRMAINATYHHRFKLFEAGVLKEAP